MTHYHALDLCIVFFMQWFHFLPYPVIQLMKMETNASNISREEHRDLFDGSITAVFSGKDKGEQATVKFIVNKESGVIHLTCFTGKIAVRNQINLMMSPVNKGRDSDIIQVWTPGATNAGAKADVSGGDTSVKDIYVKTDKSCCDNTSADDTDKDTDDSAAAVPDNKFVDSMAAATVMDDDRVCTKPMQTRSMWRKHM